MRYLLVLSIFTVGCNAEVIVTNAPTPTPSSPSIAVAQATKEPIPSTPTVKPSPTPIPYVYVSLSYNIAKGNGNTQVNSCVADDTLELCKHTKPFDPKDLPTVFNLYQWCSITKTNTTGSSQYSPDYTIECGSSQCSSSDRNCGINGIVTSRACKLPPFTWIFTIQKTNGCHTWAYGFSGWETIWSNSIQVWK